MSTGPLLLHMAVRCWWLWPTQQPTNLTETQLAFISLINTALTHMETQGYSCLIS